MSINPKYKLICSLKSPNKISISPITLDGYFIHTILIMKTKIYLLGDFCKIDLKLLSEQSQEYIYNLL